MSIETAKQYIKRHAKSKYNKHYDNSAIVETTMRSGWIVHDFGLSVEHDIDTIHDVSLAWLTSTHEERINKLNKINNKLTYDFIMLRDGNKVEIQRLTNISSLRKTHEFIGTNTLGTMPVFRKISSWLNISIKV